MPHHAMCVACATNTNDVMHTSHAMHTSKSAIPRYNYDAPEITDWHAIHAS